MSENEEKSSAIKQLMRILDDRVGDDITGYWGVVKVDDCLIHAIKEANLELNKLLLFKARLDWLHTGSGIVDADGYEWGVARIKFNEQGQMVDAQWTLSDHSDLDLEMAKENPQSFKS